MDATRIRLKVFKEQKENIYKYVDKKWDNYDLKNYHFLSANLSKCMPDIAPEQHKLVYKNILSYRALQGVDTHFYNIFNKIKGVDDTSNKIIDRQLPGIFVSFHLGSFRSALAFLVKANIDVVLIIDPLPYKLQKDSIIKQYEKVKAFFNSTSDLIIFPADKKDLSIQILAKTNKKYSVLAFIDGNTGFNGAFNQKNTVKIDFLGQKVSFRRGLAMLSYYTKCPMYPMISHYDKEFKPRWDVYDAIISSKDESPMQYSERAIKELFGTFEKSLKKYPDQWEGWLYLHKFFNLTPPVDLEDCYDPKEELVPNTNVGLFSYDDIFYVFNKENYKIVEVDENTFEKIARKEIFISENQEEDLNIKFMVTKGILVPKKTKNEKQVS